VVPRRELFVPVVDEGFFVLVVPVIARVKPEAIKAKFERRHK